MTTILTMCNLKKGQPMSASPFLFQKILLGAFLASASLPSHSLTEDLQTMDTIIVSDSVEDDTPLPEPPQSRFSLPQSVEAVQVLTRKNIEEIKPRDVVNLIEHSLGLSIRRQGARVHTFTYNRGDSVSIVLDGVYLTSTTANRVLGDIPPEAVESIQFLRDSSVITIGPLMRFGSASGGAPNQGFILIKTRNRKPDANYSTEIKSSYATYDTWKTHGFTNQSFIDGKLNIGAGYQHSESNGKLNWNNDYRFETFLLNSAYIDKGLELYGSLYVNQGWRDIQRAVGIYEGIPPNSNVTAAGELSSSIWRYDPMDTLVATFNGEYSWTDNQITTLTAGYSDATGSQLAYYTNIDPATISGRNSEDWAKEWTISHTIIGSQNLFKAGLQHLEWYQLSEGKSDPNQEQIYGLAFSYEYQLSDSLLLDTALRVDKKHVIHSPTKYLSNGSEIKIAEGRWTDESYVASVGAAWNINNIYRVSARYAFNYTPTPESLTTINNKTLPTEKRHRNELALTANFSPAFRLSLTPFYYYIKNAKVSSGSIKIEDEDKAISTITLYDVANSEIRKGSELSLKGNFANHTLIYELGWSHLYKSSDNDKSDIPDNKYNARLSWSVKALTSSINVLNEDPYMSNDYIVGNFTIVNMNIDYQFTPRLRLSIYGENLTDKPYATMNKGSINNVSASGKNSCWGVLRDVGVTYGIELAMKF